MSNPAPSDSVQPSPAVWETPPSARRPRTDWQPTSEELQAHPGQWQRIRENSKSAGLTSHIKTGQLTAFRPKGHFQSRSTKNPDGSYNIYARFVGEDASQYAE